MHEMITALDERGFIERRRDPLNRRTLLISLTSQGRAMLETYDQHVQQFEERMLEGLSAAERRQLEAALVACRRALRTDASRTSL
jgi:DNA-binding MarR family transcriptional regulator